MDEPLRWKRYQMFLSGMTPAEIAEKEGVHVVTVRACIKVYKDRAKKREEREKRIANVPIWSSTPPTVPGWYWCRHPKRYDTHLTMCVRVLPGTGDGLVVLWPGEGTLDAKLVADIPLGIEWYGPITPPE